MGTVMIVEDDADVRQGLVALMQLRGYAVESAANGKEALQKLERREPPCVILLDLIMPEMDGWQLREALLRNPALAEVPVIVLSALADVDAHARSLSAVDFLQKPVDYGKLYALVSEHC